MLYIISGGLKRLSAVADKVVPFMALLYVIGGLVVILVNIHNVPSMFVSIFKGAFSLKAATGGAIGIGMKEAMRYGVARGLYSNEAGEGSAAVMHSSAQVDHPSRQGLYGIADVFIDTMIICSVSGFTVLLTGVARPDAEAAILVSEAFGTVLPILRYVVYISLFLFCATSLMSQWYFGNVSLNYLFGGKKAVTVYKWIFPITVIIGSMASHNLVWLIQDCALGLLVLPNLIALVIMAGKVRALTKDFFSHEPVEKF